MEINFIYITTSNKEEARNIGSRLVHSRLAACVNILDNVNSIYWWEDEVQDEHESVIIAKTTAEQVPKLIETVKSLHSYSCPCIVTLPVKTGNPDFLEWISDQVGT